MGALEYPREWFRVSAWADEPFARTFARETESFLFTDNGRRSKKWTDYDRWYPTREEAQAVIDERLANKADRERMNRIRDAAPDLLGAAQDALQALVGVDKLLHEHGMMTGVECPAIATLRAAIAKATGGAA